MKEEYIVISKTAIQKRIKELEDSVYSSDNALDVPKRLMDSREKFVLKEIMSKSTHLIPEIEKAFDEARKLKTFNLKDIPLDVKLGYEVEKEEYISNLKLDI